MTREEAIYRLKNMAWLYGSAEREQNIEAIDMAIEALSAPQTDLISRADAIKAVASITMSIHLSDVICDKLLALPSADAEWIPCSERLPEDLEAVNVTWVNHNPPVYYQYAKDVPNADTAVYYRGAWYWWDATVIDVLAEYGEYCNAEQIDKDIEVVAWMPLPTPYKGGDDE